MRALLGSLAVLILAGSSVRAETFATVRHQRFWGWGWGDGYHVGWTGCPAGGECFAGDSGPPAAMPAPPPGSPAVVPLPAPVGPVPPPPLTSRLPPGTRLSSSPRSQIVTFGPGSWFSRSESPMTAPTGSSGRLVRLPPVTPPVETAARETTIPEIATETAAVRLP